MLTLFCACLATMAYVYFGYPLLLWLGMLGRRRSIRLESASVLAPMITVIVAAHNEESQIEAKIRNVLDSEYPRDRLEILVGSDGSSDRTEAIVRQFAEANGAKLGKIAQPLRAALTGRAVSPPVFDVMVVLGQAEALARIRDAAT